MATRALHCPRVRKSPLPAPIPQTGPGGSGRWCPAVVCGEGSCVPHGAFVPSLLSNKARRTSLQRSSNVPREAWAEKIKWKNPQSKRKEKQRCGLRKGQMSVFPKHGCQTLMTHTGILSAFGVQGAIIFSFFGPEPVFTG